MKQILFWTAAAGALLLSACNNVEPETPADSGSLAVTVSQELQTKAVSTTALDHEKQLNKMRVLVYDSAGELYKDEALTSPFTSKTIPNVKTGTYSVYALANTCAAVSDVKTTAKLSATAVTLSDCSFTASTGFVMHGGQTGISVAAGSTATPANIAVTRYPARVKLVSVKNGLAASLGDLTVENVMLINGYSSWNLGATGSPTTSMNAAGRSGNGSGDIIASAASADLAAYSFKEVPAADQTLASGSAAKTYGYYFYSFPNTVSTDKTGAKVTGGKARLVVKAKFGGKSYYYPVTLSSIERNKCYDVSLIITGAGSDDPNVPVVKGSLGVTISVSDWTEGSDYTETI